MRRSQIMRQLRDHLAATLDATPYQQDGETWHVALRPLMSGLEQEPEPLSHLSLEVSLDSTATDPGYRAQPGRLMRWVSQLSVSFTYRLRPDSQVTDLDLASDAAEDVAASVFGHELWAPEILVTAVSQGFQVLFPPDEPTVVVSMTFTILHTSET